MSIQEIAKRLATAQERLDRAVQAGRARCGAEEQDEYWAAHGAMLVLERELAAAKGAEYAIPLDFPVKWDIGAPLPHVVQNDWETFLTFYVRVANIAWDGTYVTLKSPGSGEVESLALVEFLGCISARLGTPNDEVFEGHLLAGKGMDGYTAQQVVNSRWLAELEAINKVHHCYNPDCWRKRKHFVFWFHDKTFECIAESFKVELYQESMAALLARVCERLLR
jgi:hypothetical protein